MADGITYRTERRRGKLLVFIIGLAAGALIGWYLAQSLGNNAGTDNKAPAPRTSQTKQPASEGLVPREQQPTLNTRLTEYSQLLVEATRENIDAPSDEATAAKETLDSVTLNLLKDLDITPSKPLYNDFMNLNNELLQYASNARTVDDTSTVDAAFTALLSSLKKEYRVANQSELDSRVTSLKNTVNAGITSFVNRDYKNSYAKQLQAEAEIHAVFSLLQKK